MRKHQLLDKLEGLTKIVDYVNSLATQHPNGSGDELHEPKYLFRAVMRFDWAQQPI